MVIIELINSRFFLDISMVIAQGQENNDKEVMYSDSILRAFPIIVADRELFAYLIMQDIDEYEIIIGMDWLSKYHTKIDSRKKIVVSHPLDTNQFVFKGIQTSSRFPLISAMKAQRLLERR